MDLAEGLDIGSDWYRLAVIIVISLAPSFYFLIPDSITSYVLFSVIQIFKQA